MIKKQFTYHRCGPFSRRKAFLNTRAPVRSGEDLWRQIAWQEMGSFNLVRLGLRSEPGEQQRTPEQWLNRLTLPCWKPRVRALSYLTSHPLPPALVPTLIEQVRPFLTDPLPWIRTAALSVLTEFHDPQFLPLFHHALEDEHDTVRMVAVQVLADQGLQQMLQVLSLEDFCAYLADPQICVRIEVICAIKRLGLVAHLQDILFPLLNDEEPLIRYHTLQTLATLPDEQITTALRTLCEDEDELVREAAQVALTERVPEEFL